MLAPIAWRTPPRHYGPWERVTSLLTETLVELGMDVTLHATGDSETRGELRSVVPRGYEEDSSIDAKVHECLHIAEVMEHANEYDIIHNQFDFLPLSYSRLIDTPIVTTIHGFSSERILPVYRKYDSTAHYVSISDADRAAGLSYAATVYHGIDLERFTYRDAPEDYLLYFGRIHHDKGTREAIEIARSSDHPLVIAGIVHDDEYFRTQVEPFIDGDRVRFVGSVGPLERDALLGGARALLHPINFAEPFGLSVVESMACGTPVIAMPRGSMPELIEHGRNGYLVQNVDDAVAHVGRLAEIDRAATRRVVEQRFTRQRMAEGYMAVYEQILQGNTKR